MCLFVWRLCGRVEEPEDALVHAEHDGGAGDGPEQVGRHSAVEAEHALLFEDQLEALDQVGVFGPAVGDRGLP